MPLSISSAPRNLSDGNTAGTVLGNATNSAGLPDNIAFNGGTPVPFLLQGALRANLGMLNLNVVSASPASILANTSQEAAFTLVGVAATDVVIAAIKPTTQAGIIVGSARVSATNTVQLSFGNNTGATLTPTTTESYQFITVPARMTFSATLTPASVAASTTVEQVFTITGGNIQPGMVMAVNKPTVNAGLVITQCRAISANQIGITFVNCTAAAVTPTAAQSYKFFAAQGLRQAALMQVMSVALTPASVAANTTAEQTFTVPGLGLLAAVPNSENVIVNKPTIQAGLSIAGARASAADTLAINFANATAGALTPTAGELYTVAVFNTVNPAAGANVLVGAAMSMDASSELMRMGW